MTDRVFRATSSAIKHIGDIIRANIITNTDLRGDYYLWAGIAQGEVFVYESEFIPIKLPALKPIVVEIYPKGAVPGQGDLITMILSSPDWSEEHRLIRTVTLNAYDLR